MENIFSNLVFWSALSGLVGSILIFRFGIPPKIDRKGSQCLVTEQVDHAEVKKAKKYDFFGNMGIILISIGFLFQIIDVW